MPLGKQAYRFVRPAFKQLSSQTVPAEVLYGFKNFVEYQRGTLNVVLSCPHDGDHEPSHIPDRIEGFVVEEQSYFSHKKCKRAVPVEQVARHSVKQCQELFTLDLTINVANELEALTGKRPHIVICHLHRNKLDTNRTVGEATFGVPDSIRAYNDFHKFISHAKKNINGPGLFLDMHGHKHFEGWIELGYLIPKLMLNSGILLPEESSISALAHRSNRNYTFKDLISGGASLGALLQQEGYRAMPSPKFEFPGCGRYFRGGYNTRTHGSHYGGLIDAIQIETPSFLCNGEQCILYTQALARSIHKFVDMHYST